MLPVQSEILPAIRWIVRHTRVSFPIAHQHISINILFNVHLELDVKYNSILVDLYLHLGSRQNVSLIDVDLTKRSGPIGSARLHLDVHIVDVL